MTSSVAGLMTPRVRPSAASTHWPSMNKRLRDAVAVAVAMTGSFAESEWNCPGLLPSPSLHRIGEKEGGEGGEDRINLAVLIAQSSGGAVGRFPSRLPYSQRGDGVESLDISVFPGGSRTQNGISSPLLRRLPKPT